MTAKFFWKRVLGEVLNDVLGWHYHKKSPNSISGDFKHDVSDCKYETKAVVIVAIHHRHHSEYHDIFCH